jgi:predicted MFS family arabinose efflux permease
MTADYFGENNNATNYGLVYSSKLVSGLVGAGLGAVVVDTWGYGTAFVIAGSVGVACAFIAVFLRQPKLPTQAPTEPAPIEVTPTKERALVVD